MSPNQAQEPIRTFHSKLATLEVTLWLILALLISGRPLLFLILYPRDISMVFRNFYLELLAGVICVLFPFIFRLTFSHFPLQLIRRSRESQTVHKRQLEENTLPSNPRGQSEPKVSTTAIYPAPATTSGYMELLAENAVSSRQIAEGIYTRAGVYLLIGAIIAISGLVFFYTQTSPLRDLIAKAATIEDSSRLQSSAASTSSTVTALSNPQPQQRAPQADSSALLADLLIAMVPRFGILFFIEFIAFFFLRQYRSAMDEFRHFEAIKRSREDRLALVALMKAESGSVELFDLLQGNYFSSSSGKLAAGETTESLETRKLTRDELAMFEKFADIISLLRK